MAGFSCRQSHIIPHQLQSRLVLTGEWKRGHTVTYYSPPASKQISPHRGVETGPHMTDVIPILLWSRVVFTRSGKAPLTAMVAIHHHNS
jgi:hypothetical protein